MFWQCLSCTRVFPHRTAYISASHSIWPRLGEQGRATLQRGPHDGRFSRPFPACPGLGQGPPGPRRCRAPAAAPGPPCCVGVSEPPSTVHRGRPVRLSLSRSLRPVAAAAAAAATDAAALRGVASCARGASVAAPAAADTHANGQVYPNMDQYGSIRFQYGQFIQYGHGVSLLKTILSTVLNRIEPY